MLPDKWCIKLESEKDGDILREYFNKEGLNRKNWIFNAISDYYFLRERCIDRSPRKPEGYTLISFSELLKYINSNKSNYYFY